MSKLSNYQLFNIFDFLTGEELLLCQEVSPLWNSIINYFKIWRNQYERKFPDISKPETLDFFAAYLLYSSTPFIFTQEQLSNLKYNSINWNFRQNPTLPVGSYIYGDWLIYSDDSPTYLYILNANQIVMELACSSNGWFRYVNDNMEDICVYSSAGKTQQRLHNHITLSDVDSNINGFLSNSDYYWGKWVLSLNDPYFLIFNTDNPTQLLVLSKYQEAFIFYPAKTNFRTNGPYYYPTGIKENTLYGLNLDKIIQNKKEELYKNAILKHKMGVVKNKKKSRQSNRK